MIEFLVYIGVAFVVLGAGYLALYQGTYNTKTLRRNADDIAAALNVGERWRQDVRNATGTIRIEGTESNQVVHIPQRGGEVLYEWAEGQLSRQSRADQPKLVVLPRVLASVMAPEPRAHVTAWRWDLTIKGNARSVRVKPVFSFAAVPTSKEAQ